MITAFETVWHIVKTYEWDVLEDRALWVKKSLPNKSMALVAVIHIISQWMLEMDILN